MSKYIIADPKINDGWTHLFLETADDGEGLVEVERGCRFVFDRERLELVHVDVEVGDRMVPASSSAADDLLDSLLHGNPFSSTNRKLSASESAITFRTGARTMTLSRRKRPDSSNWKTC